ncbi:MAG: transposase [Rhizobiaceae bacterium]
MTDLIICSAGIDVAKDKLDIGLFPGGQHVTVAYTDEGLAALDRFVAEHKVARIGFEASGGYEWRLLAHLRKGSVAAARFQPGQIRAFGKSRLQRAKNDRLDALLIAQFTASQSELPKLPDEKLDGLAGHLTYIEQLEDRTATLKTMLEASRDPRIRRAQMADIKRLEARRSAELALLVKTIRANAGLAGKLKLIVSIKGIGERSALALLVRLPEIGSLSREQAAALAGVAPYDNDSGAKSRKRCVAGGRQRLRKSLFMAAFCATRWNKDLKATYLNLRARGKHHLTAVIAVARKLVILANSVVERDRPWTETRAPA